MFFSGTVYAGEPNPGETPDAWTASAHNTVDGVNKTLDVYVICSSP